MQVFGPNELLEDVLQSGLCIGCGACVNLCPYFRTYRGKTAMLFPCTSTAGRCHAFCPKTEVDLDELSRFSIGEPYTGKPIGSYRSIFMSRAGQAAGSGEFQDGGSVSALMKYALESGLADASVLTGRKDLVPEPGLATMAGEVAGFASSKYTAAPTLAALNDGVKRGFSRMGVVGTPCQLTAVAQMRANPTGADDFVDPVAFTVGLFCTWALDTRGFLEFIQTRAPEAKIRKMVIPPPPAGIMVLETDTGQMEISLDDIRHLVPAGCGICPDMTAEWADVSVGAMEGFEKANTLIVRSARGEELVKGAADAGYIVLENFPDENRRHLEGASAGKKKRAFVQAQQDNMINTGQDKRAALRVNPETLEKIISD